MTTEKFCEGSKCAKLTIRKDGEPDKVFTSKIPPITVETGGGKTTFVHGMRSPIVKTFDREITGVSVVGDVQYYLEINGSTDVSRNPRRECPLPGTYPAIKSKPDLQPLLDSGELTDIYWIGNTLYGFFDGRYDFNSGRCEYTVYFGGEQRYLKFSDGRGILYEVQVNESDDLPEYIIDCDDCCGEDEICCDSPKYPGYTCYPIPPVLDKLEVNRNDLSRIYQ